MYYQLRIVLLLCEMFPRSQLATCWVLVESTFLVQPLLRKRIPPGLYLRFILAKPMECSISDVGFPYPPVSCPITVCSIPQRHGASDVQRNRLTQQYLQWTKLMKAFRIIIVHRKNSALESGNITFLPPYICTIFSPKSCYGNTLDWIKLTPRGVGSSSG